MNKFILTLADALLLAPSCTKINREENLRAEGAEGDTWKKFQDVIGWGSATKEDVGAYYQKMVAGTVLLLGTLSK